MQAICDENDAAEPQDIDPCMIAGARWPFHLGGTLDSRRPTADGRYTTH